ncbi:MAG: NAD(P)/FAD-dependent oxidoreductase [Bacteroidales bacterium]|nr:NAD(P)/FAD-dependent oxidoreductase [Bacteroidales bacterium]
MKSLTVIGAGISGLTCAIYAQRPGFRTVILEKAGGPGGRIFRRSAGGRPFGMAHCPDTL